LHADPHPGNLLRTESGKLAILDFGLVTEVPSDLQTAMVGYISHLFTDDYEKIPDDLVAMGFIPEGKERAVYDAGVVKILAEVFKALAKGGGANRFNQKTFEKTYNKAAIEEVSAELRRIQREYGNFFQIPSYFALILRTFSTLEGLGLSHDRDYSIAKECYPALSKRLVDGSPQMQYALESILYKPGTQELNLKRVNELVNSFEKYTSTVQGESNDAGTKEFLKIIFSQKTNYVQEIVVRELARGMDVSFRRSAGPVMLAPLELESSIMAFFEEQAPVATPVVSTFLQPFFRASQVLASLKPAISTENEEDQQTLELVDQIWKSLAQNAQTTDTSLTPNSNSLDQFEIPGRKFFQVAQNDPELRKGLQSFSLRLGGEIARRAAKRLRKTTPFSKIQFPSGYGGSSTFVSFDSSPEVPKAGFKVSQGLTSASPNKVLTFSSKAVETNSNDEKKDGVLRVYRKNGCHICEGLWEKLETLDLKDCPFERIVSINIDSESDVARHGLTRPRSYYDLNVPIMEVKNGETTLELPRASPRISRENLLKHLQLHGKKAKYV